MGVQKVHSASEFSQIFENWQLCKINHHQSGKLACQNTVEK
jgi:hypothetical protein